MKITPFSRELSASVVVPGSKSLTNRALLLAALATGKSILRGGLHSDDSAVMMAALKEWGVDIHKKENTWTISGKGGRFSAGNTNIFLGNAGTAMRFLTAAAGFSRGSIRLFGKERMHERPLKDLISALSQMGMHLSSEKNNGCPPILIEATGTLLGGRCVISGSVSSQFLSALLLIAASTKKGVELHILPPLVSRPYLEMTITLLSVFGIRVEKKSEYVFYIPPQKVEACIYEIEADASSASHIFSLAAARSGSVYISNFPHKSLQGDADFLGVLEKMGAKISREKEGVRVSRLRPLRPLGEIDLGGMPDAAMNAVVLAALAKGRSKIMGLQTLRVKECDRIAVLEKNLHKMGAQVSSGKDFLEIDGNPDLLHGAKIECFDDHRIAMCFAVLGSVIDGVDILDPKCVEKTFPNFWDIFEACRA